MSYTTGTNEELLYVNTSIGATLATFTTEAQLNTAATMFMQPKIPGGFFLQNRAIKITAAGTLAALTATTPTYTFTVRGGPVGPQITGPIMCGSGAIATISGATTSSWLFDAVCVLKTMGAGPPGTANSTLYSYGRIVCNGLSSTANLEVIGGLTTAGTLVAPGTITTFDPTIDNFINFNVACSASNAANTITLKTLQVYGLN